MKIHGFFELVKLSLWRSLASQSSSYRPSSPESPCALRSTFAPVSGLAFTELGFERKWRSIGLPFSAHSFNELGNCRLWRFVKLDFSRRCKWRVFSSPCYGFSKLLHLPWLPCLLLLLSARLPLISAADTSDFIEEARSSYGDLEICDSLVVKKTIINYGALHACIFDHSLALSVPALLAMVVLFFYILAQAAQNHFSPVVARMAEMLHLSPSTGGVTLLALGNGAPDVFASIAAVWGGNPRIGLGAIVSAGFFVTAFVVGFVALYAAPFPLKPSTFLRDVSFYILAVILMFLLYMTGKVYVWQAVGLVSLYVFFVAVVFCMDHDRGKGRILKPSISDLNSARGDSHAEDEPKAYIHDELVENGHTNGQSLNHNQNVDGSWNHGSDIEVGRSQSKSLKSHGQIMVVTSGIAKAKQPKDFSAVLGTLVHSLLCCGSPDTSRCKQFLKLQLLWQFPVEVMLHSTIPAVDPSKWNRIYSSLNFVCCPLIFLYIISAAVSPFWRMVFIIPGINFPLWALVLLQGSVLGLTHYVFMKEPPRKELPIAVVTSFVMSVFWISFIAGELLGCLATLGKLLKLPPVLLGLTVLAWGNSIGDLVADVAVARAGQPAMAMAGCFAGPMFNMLVGFGLALAMKTSRMHPAPYLLEYNPSIVVAFGFLFTSLLSSLLVITWSRFQVPRFWGFCLITLYITFVVVSISNANLL